MMAIMTSGPAGPPAVRKAVIPAAGLGTRFLPATKAQPKEMLPVVDKPAIQYVVEEAVAAGIDDILIVSGRTKRCLEDHFDRNVELEQELARRGKDDDARLVRELAEMADVFFVRQGEALGLGHAIGLARSHVGDDPFVVLLGDDLMVGEPSVLGAMMAAYQRRGRSVVALKEVDPEEISSYGCAVPEAGPTAGRSAGPGAPGDEDALVRILEIVEKPDPSDAPSNLAVMGRYVFTPEIFGAIERVRPGVGGEIQITDAIALLMADQEVYGYPFREGRYDTGNKLDYLRAVVELAAARDDLGPPFKRFLADFVRREGLV